MRSEGKTVLPHTVTCRSLGARLCCVIAYEMNCVREKCGQNVQSFKIKPKVACAMLFESKPFSEGCCLLVERNDGNFVTFDYRKDKVHKRQMKMIINIKRRIMQP